MARFSVKDIIKQSIVVLLATTVLSIFTGLKMENTINFIVIEYPVFLIIIPSFINITGDLSDVLSSRMSSYLYKGEISTSFKPFKLYLTNLMAIIAVAETGFLFVAIFSNIFANYFLNSTTPWFRLILIVMISGFIALLTIIIISSIILRWVFLRGLDPDSQLAPISTSTGDLIGILTLLTIATKFI